MLGMLSGQKKNNLKGPWHSDRNWYLTSKIGCYILYLVLKMKMIPTTNYIVIEPEEIQTTTESGIIIPDTAKNKPERGTVVAAALQETPTGELAEACVSVGDTVIYKKWGGSEITVEGKKFVVVKEEDILVKI
jgi:chaperonin GroES